MEEKYRSHMVNEDGKEIQWRYGSPPEYNLVNNLFEQGRTKEWPSGSLEETVQNVVKSWEMELSHKTRLEDFRSINPTKFKFSVNGKKFLSAEETLKLGSYNALLESEMPSEMQGYRADEESFDSSHHIFRTAFPRGFSWELLKLYSGPPEISFKFRHWGYMEGPYKGHGPTGDQVQFIGMAVIKVLSFVDDTQHNAIIRLHYLITAVLVYSLWRERNKRIFTSVAIPVPSLILEIRTRVAAKLQLWKIKCSWPSQVQDLLHKWRSFKPP